MISITFIYERNLFTKYIIIDKNELIINILLEYSIIINKDLKDLYFIFNGKNLSFKNNEKISNFNYNNITIIVFNLNNKKENKGFKQRYVLIVKRFQ